MSNGDIRADKPPSPLGGEGSRVRSSASVDDPRVIQALEEYLAALEAGQKPERRAFLARHADVAGPLAECLEGMEALHGPGPQPAEPPAASMTEPDDLLRVGVLGDFRIVREVGRGGMGVVYEAEQVSLGRRVALKVLPFASTLDSRQLQRFHNEARAAAGLHHTNVVPVYAVGCERGVHYYAMQFIEGRTLAELIAQQRSGPPSQVPTVAAAERVPAATTLAPAAQATSTAPRDMAYFRRVAEWGSQAAEALDYGHTLGVVHRDVKPANLLVDGAGRLWVTDFGLAQVQSDARLTMTGALVGTLRYMSPEQALAKRVVIDHRTDVYSLGATLYEMLTLEPAFGGNDRQELLRQIAFEEPSRLRRLCKTIPAELETIVLKAMEKNPAERYATAKELADDLRHWLEDRPIQARRPSWVQVARRWVRRHRGMVWAGGLGLLLAVVVLAVSSVLLWRETNKVKQALVERDAQYQRAERQYRRADNNFNYIMNTTVDFLEEVDDADRPGGPSIAELRQILEDRLEQLLQSCQASAGTDALALRDAAWWREDVGRYYFWRGDYVRAEKKYHTALVLYEALASEHPEEVTIHYPFSRCLFQLGNVHYTAGRTDEARACYRRSLTEYRLRLQLDPDWRAHADLAFFLVTCPLREFRDAKDALRLALRAVELRPEDEDCWSHLGVAHYRNGNWREAIVSLQESMHRYPKQEYASFFMAMAHHQLGERGQAKEEFERGVRLMAENKKRWPALWRYRAEAAELLGIKDTPPGAKANSPGINGSDGAISGR